MILRKPYAILIKYFKLIHVVMFFFFGYLVFILRKIYLFFSEYIKTSNFTYFENMASEYIPTEVFFMVVILLIFGISIFLLMHKKEKPVLFYKVLIAYCSILLISFIYLFFFFKSLDDTVYEPLSVVLNRDLSLFIYIVNFFFVIVAFIRGFGFDIKKFSFDRDKRELNLEESDSEEYELNVNIEKEDVINYFNRQKREFKYYLKENALFFTIIGIILIIFLGLYLYYNIFVINKVYNEGDNIGDTLVYKVTDSYITNKDKYGQIISEDNDYFVVYLTISNNKATGYLNENGLRLQLDDDYYYPSTSSCDLFSDLGVCYKNQELKVNNTYNFIVIYKTKKEYQKAYFEILKSGSDYSYHKILLKTKPYQIETINYQIGDEFTVSDKKYKITKYEIASKAKYQYEECVSNVCNKFIKNVLPTTGEMVLLLEFDTLNEISDDFLNSAIGINYDKTDITGKNIRLIDKYDNIVYYSIPSNIKKLKSFNVTITTRTKIYNVLLEEDNE